MIESGYTKAVHNKLPKHIKAWKINDNFAGGVPDALYRDLRGTNPHVWAEYKLVKNLPKRGTTCIVPNLSALQNAWLAEARAAGETACVIVGCENEKSKSGGAMGVILTDPVHWGLGFDRDFFLQHAMDYRQIADSIASGAVSDAQGVHK